MLAVAMDGDGCHPPLDLPASSPTERPMTFMAVCYPSCHKDQGLKPGKTHRES
jgi:hypothetical protein